MKCYNGSLRQINNKSDMIHYNVFNQIFFFLEFTMSGQIGICHDIIIHIGSKNNNEG